MPELHTYVGYFIVGMFALGWVWGFGARVLRRGPGEWFWRWLTAVQLTAGVQALIGITLFVMGRRQGWLHYAYGLFPIGALVVAHAVARREEYRGRPWLPFAWAAFFSFGLTLRALMTGLGIG